MLDAANPFFTDVAKGVEESAAEGRLVAVLVQQRQPAGPRERRTCTDCTEQRVQGILITPVDPEAPDARRGRGARHPARRRGPDPADAHRCALSRWTTCSAAGSRSSTSRPGHERIAFVGGPHDDRAGQRPARGRSPGAVRPRGGSRTSWSTDHGRTDRGGGTRRRGADRRACRRPTARPRRSAPTTCSRSDCCSSASALGLRVPDDLAIVGYDDIDFAAAAAVPLTSVRQPRQQLGGDGRSSCCSTRRTTRTTGTGRSCSPRSSWSGLLLGPFAAPCNAGLWTLDPRHTSGGASITPRYSWAVARKAGRRPRRAPGGCPPVPRARPTMACVTPCV